MHRKKNSKKEEKREKFSTDENKNFISFISHNYQPVRSKYMHKNFLDKQ